MLQKSNIRAIRRCCCSQAASSFFNTRLPPALVRRPRGLVPRLRPILLANPPLESVRLLQVSERSKPRALEH